MNSETITFNDIAKAEVFVQSGERFETTFLHVWNELSNPWNERKDRNRPRRGIVEYNSEYAILWDYIYLKSPYVREGVRDWYIAWGIRFPELTSEWKDADLSLPLRTHAFVCFGADSGELPEREILAAHGIPAEWGVFPHGAERVIIGRALSDFSDDPALLLQELSQCIKAKAGEIEPFIHSLAAAV